jgi:hypothetical protein
LHKPLPLLITANYLTTEDQSLEFGILVIGICLDFDACDLEFRKPFSTTGFSLRLILSACSYRLVPI